APPAPPASLHRAELRAPTGILVGASLTCHDPGMADLLLQVGGRELTFGMCAQFVESCIHCVDPALLVARYGLLEGAPRGVRLTQVHERDNLLLYRCVFCFLGAVGRAA